MISYLVLLETNTNIPCRILNMLCCQLNEKKKIPLN
uniref:Uncharacterized protein n=1 Tax=Manihot esculenta TaxID=3983 RepID=A0A2C9UEN5_MANES